MANLVNKTDEMRGTILPVMQGLGIASALVVLVEYLLRFAGAPSVLAAWRSAEDSAMDAAAFAEAPLTHLVFALSAAVCALSAAIVLRDGAAEESRASRVFVWSALLAIVSGMILGLTVETSTLAGANAPFFYFGYGAVWYVFLGMRHEAIRRGDADMAVEWTLHAAGLAYLPAMVHVIAIVILTAGFTLAEAVATGISLGFAALVFSTFSACLLMRARPAMR